MKKVIGMTAFLAVMVLAGVAIAEVSVPEGVACASVADRKPVGTATAFPADIGKVCVFTRIAGVAAPGTVTHRWIFGGKTVAEVKLPVNGSPWRVWSDKKISRGQTGAWKVEVADGEGKVLKTVEFTVGAEAPAREPGPKQGKEEGPKTGK